jgi:hypothetical protein
VGCLEGVLNSSDETFWEICFANVNEHLFAGNNPYLTLEINENAFGFGRVLWINSVWNERSGARFTMEAKREDDEEDTWNLRV